MKKVKKKVNKEEVAESWCFVCKDGGDLYICDYKNCLKVYHAKCVGKDDSFFDKGGQLTCQWHNCYNCDKKHAKYQCYCCPKAWCEGCIENAEWAKVRGSKGFCNICLKVLLLGEGLREEDSDEEKVDFKDRDTIECLLYEYWLIIKDNENLSLEDLRSADNIMRKVEKSVSDTSGSEKYMDDSSESTSAEDSGSDFSTTPSKKRKRPNSRKSSDKTPVKSKTREFIGWGSRPLIDFLQSIGKDTSTELPENEVVSIINKYIAQNKLFVPDRKKKIVCDEKLKCLFGRKTLMKNSIGKLLESHFFDNAEFYELDQQGYSSEEKSENVEFARKKQKTVVTSKKTRKDEVVLESPKSYFAAIIMENIKLVFLKRRVVMELLKDPETFESKMIGTFVKVKSDPYDYHQPNPYQLVRVTGVKNILSGAKKEDILLQVAERYTDFAVSKLSDADFSEEECKDLRRRVNCGDLQKLTIVEIEEKAKILHQIIMKEWITQALVSLQNQIDHANEKGRRAELYHLLERRALLETEAEQRRLLEEIPSVIADIPEPEISPEDAKNEMADGDESPSKSTFIGNSEPIDKKLQDDVTFSGHKVEINNNFFSGKTESHYGNGTTNRNETSSNIQGSKVVTGLYSLSGSGPVSANCGIRTTKTDEALMNNQAVNLAIQATNDKEIIVIETKKPVIVDLSSSSDSESGDDSSPEDLDALMWHCAGPDGDTYGPCSLSTLKEWRDDAPYASRCKVWKTDESQEKAIMLPSVIQKFYPGS